MSLTAPSEPGTVATLAERMMDFALALSPMLEITSAVGPTNSIPIFSQISARYAFSARNP